MLKTDTASIYKLSDWLDGKKGIRLEVAGETFIVRQPTTDELDDAQMIYEMTRQATLAQATDLRGVPVPDLQDLADAIETEIKSGKLSKRDKLDKQRQLKRLRGIDLPHWTAMQRADKARNRFLSFRLLCYEDGRPVFGNDESDTERWDALPPAVKDQIGEAVDAMLEVINTVPFDWETWRNSGSSLASDSDDSPSPASA